MSIQVRSELNEMAEPKQFPKIVFKLTPGQRKKLSGWVEEINKGYVASNGTDHRRAVLADVRVLTNEVHCFLIQPSEGRVINRAIMRARKQLR